MENRPVADLYRLADHPLVPVEDIPLAADALTLDDFDCWRCWCGSTDHTHRHQRLWLEAFGELLARLVDRVEDPLAVLVVGAMVGLAVTLAVGLVGWLLIGHPGT